MKSNGASRLLGRWNGELHISKSFRRSIRLYVATGIIFASCLPSSTLFAVQLQPGDILVTTDIGTAASPDPAILLIDPVTGDRTVISDNSHGAGTTFVPPVPPDDQMFAGLGIL